MIDIDAPHAPEAEQALLSAMLIDNDVYTKVAAVIDPSDFYRSANRLIFQALADGWKEGREMDAVTLAKQLRATGDLESAGGLDYIGLLIDFVPTAANAKEYANDVREASRRRKIMNKAMDLARTASAGDMDAVSTSLDQLMSVAAAGKPGGFSLMKESVWPVMERVDDLISGNEEARGLLTGFHDLDKMLVGFEPGDLVVVAARPSMGKSAFVFNVLMNLASKNEPCALVSLEMSSEAVTMRCLAAESRVGMQNLRIGHTSKDVHQRLAKAAGHITAAPFYIDDTPVPTVPELAAKMSRLVNAHGVKAVAIDYLQLMKGSGENRNQEISGITRDLKLVAGKLGVPIILLSQLSRKVEERKDKRPMLSDLRDSGSIEQDADAVIFLYRAEYYATTDEQKRLLSGQAEAIIAKQRNGPVGSCPLHFHKEYARFDSVERRISAA